MRIDRNEILEKETDAENKEGSRCNCGSSGVFSGKCESKIASLISQMSVAEKADQLGAYYFGSSIYSNANLRLGIPNLIAGECLNGVMANGATRFPQAIAMAGTWDRELMEKTGAVVAKEARAYGVHQCYTPMVAVVRDIRWGRIEESYGECPFLVGEIAVAYIKGLQGTGDNRFGSDRILACAKHYVADGEPMAGDNGAAMDISDYNLHNIHLYPFRLAIEEARVASIMPAHHLLNGIPCHANDYILNDVLRGQYNWDGYVVSDNQDLERLVHLFHYAVDYIDAARKAMAAGVHQELDVQTDNRNRIYARKIIEEGVRSGRIPQECLDASVAANLRAKFALGLFDLEPPTPDQFLESETDPPIYYADHFGRYSDVDETQYTGVKNVHENKIDRTVITDEKHDVLALEVARKAIILLKNEGDLLPLNIEELKKIAVIGPNADAVRLGGYSMGQPKYFITLLQGIRNYAGDRIDVGYAEGTGIDVEEPDGYDSQFDLELTRHAENVSKDSELTESDRIAAAVELAFDADLAILAVGGSEATTRENEDTDFIGLRGRQMELVRVVHATGTPCVVVFLGGRPDSEVWIAENIPAIIQGWYLGQETGTAIADVLFGEVNPGGKMPVTVPRGVGQVPLFYNKLETGRPRRIYRSSHEPLYPFGYGLSYTTFELKNLKLEKDRIAAGETTSISIDIANTGDRAGDEVVQLYVRARNTKRIRPRKELRGFKRIHLKPGQTEKIYFEIGKKQLEYWNESWVVEPGRYSLFIATDSSTEKLKMNNAELIVMD